MYEQHNNGGEHHSELHLKPESELSIKGWGEKVAQASRRQKQDRKQSKVENKTRGYSCIDTYRIINSYTLSNSTHAVPTNSRQAPLCIA